MRLRTGNNRRRAKRDRESRWTMRTTKTGPTWADRGVAVEIIAREVYKLTDNLLQRVTAMRPVQTTCPICRRPNPCPLHVFGAQVDFHRSRGQ